MYRQACLVDVADLFCKGKAEAVTSVTRPTGIGSVESVKDSRQMLWGDARASVADPKYGFLLSGQCDDDFALRRAVFDGIIDEDGYKFFDAGLMSNDNHGGMRRLHDDLLANAYEAINNGVGAGHKVERCAFE